MTEKYFNLRVGSPDIYGEVIRFCDGVLEDYINSFSNKEYNLQFKVIREKTEGNPILYEVTVPDIIFSGGACAPALTLNCSPGWFKRGEQVIKLTLDNEVLKIAEEQKDVFINEISKTEADKMKQGEFLWSMQQLYLAGM